MAEGDLPRSKLTLWALSVLSQATHAADHEPVPITARLRLAMAWLSVATGEGDALELWWDEARQPMICDNSDYKTAYRRVSGLVLRFEGICERMQVRYWAVRDHARDNPPAWPD